MSLTHEQAVALGKTDWWIGMPTHDIVQFQLFEDRLCMPFGEFQQAVQDALGRPVWTHEFAAPDLLRAEFLGDRPRPTFEDILNLIPAEKRIVVSL
jgi:hypothetical protein